MSDECATCDRTEIQDEFFNIELSYHARIHSLHQLILILIFTLIFISNIPKTVTPSSPIPHSPFSILSQPTMIRTRIHHPISRSRSLLAPTRASNAYLTFLFPSSFPSSEGKRVQGGSVQREIGTGGVVRGLR